MAFPGAVHANTAGLAIVVGTPCRFDAAALNGEPRVPLETLIDMDLEALRRPDFNDSAANQQRDDAMLGPGREWVPRPLIWAESTWMRTPFQQVRCEGTGWHDHRIRSEEYQCQLHYMNGAACQERVAAVHLSAGGDFALLNPQKGPNLFAYRQLAHHLSEQHGITEPRRPTRHWTHGLLSGVCSLACLDCVVAPCCFFERVRSLEWEPQGDLVPSYERRSLCCEDKPALSYICVQWLLCTPFHSLFPCWWCSVGPACEPDFSLRRLIVEPYNIEESECASKAIVCCCCPCSLVQVHREAAASGVWAGACCCVTSTPLPTPAEVQHHYGALTRDDVIRSRWNLKPLSTAAALNAMVQH